MGSIDVLLDELGAEGLEQELAIRNQAKEGEEQPDALFPRTASIERRGTPDEHDLKQATPAYKQLLQCAQE